jgi:nucleoside-diphosphate-sugar epimerase
VGDINQVKSLPAADFIVHCAASGRGGPQAYQRVYVDGCRNLTEAFAGVPLLFTSSTSVYSQTDGSLVTEDSVAVPERETGRLLMEAERVTLAAAGIVARLSGIYGPGRSVILKKFLSGEARIEEDGRRLLNQIHRDDAARAILHLANLRVGGVPDASDLQDDRVLTNAPTSRVLTNAPTSRVLTNAPTLDLRAGGVFNVSDSTPLSQIECYRELGRMFGRPLPPAGPRDPDRKRGWTHKRVSNGKLRATGWQPEYPSFLAAARGVSSSL